MVLQTLLAAIGDPTGTAGILGLAGRAALDPARLCGSEITLLIYTPATEPADPRPRWWPADAPSIPEVLVHAGITELGGMHLSDLATDDPHRISYGGSRLFPADRPGPYQERLWGRRRDVAWIGDIQLDLATVPASAELVSELPYAAPAGRPVAGLLQLTAVAPGHPVHFTAASIPDPAATATAGMGNNSNPADVWVTARGFAGALQAGDRIRLAGTARPTTRGDVVTVDDLPSHHLQLEV